MDELIFIVEEYLKGGYTARHWISAFLSMAIQFKSLKIISMMPFGAIFCKKIYPKLSECTLYAMKFSQ